MSGTVRYEARSLGLYEVDGELILSMSAETGEHVLIKIGRFQAGMICRDTASFVANELVKMSK